MRRVSRAWASLESIFLASADIRSQLPEDTKRFEGIDSEFRELMKDAVLEANCVKVCSVEGRFESLRGMRERLEMCQKSLTEYLDIKEKIFPAKKATEMLKKVQAKKQHKAKAMKAKTAMKAM